MAHNEGGVPGLSAGSALATATTLPLVAPHERLFGPPECSAVEERENVLDDDVSVGAQASTRALDRGLALLTCLSENPQGLSAPDLAIRNDLSRATVYRLLATMEARQFVTFDKDKRRYFLGRAVDPFASHETTMTLAALATVQLKLLCEATEESVGLHIRVGLQRQLVHKVEPPDQFLRYVIPVGTPHALATGASGAVLTLGLEPSEIKTALRQAKDSAQNGRYSSFSDLAAQHAAIRERGYCESTRTTVPDLASVAGPVFLHERVIAAVAISGPTVRFGAKKRQTAGQLLVEASRQISATLVPS